MFRRNALTVLATALADTPCVVLHGPRQTGKSTLARSVARARRLPYVTLDDGASLAAAVEDPDGFVAGFPDGGVFDEVQRAPQIFRALKGAIDHDRRPGRYLLTGSAHVLAIPKLQESLAGRAEIVMLEPLSQGEIEGVVEGFVDAVFGKTPPAAITSKLTRENYLARALRGGFPEAVDRPTEARRSAWFRSYASAVLQRDVRDLARVDGLTALPRLLSLVGARTAALQNASDLARGLALPPTTTVRYLSLLESVFLTRPLPPWSKNLSSRVVKAPKVHFSDAGLAAHLAGVTAGRAAEDGTVAGPILETFVVGELRKQSAWSKTMPAAFHYRTHAGAEVDAVLEDPSGRIVGVEIKAAASVDGRDFRGLRSLAEAAGDRFVRGVVLYAGATSVPFDARFMALPMEALWRLGALKAPPSPFRLSKE